MTLQTTFLLMAVCTATQAVCSIAVLVLSLRITKLLRSIREAR